MKKRISFQFEGKTYTVDVERHGKELLIEKEGKIYHVNLLPQKNTSSVSYAQEKTNNPVTETSVASSPGPAAEDASSNGMLISPITGIVNDIKAHPGEHVEKDQLLLVLEAMKMYIHLYAPRTGTVKEIYVNKNETVSNGQKLLRIE